MELPIKVLVHNSNFVGLRFFTSLGLLDVALSVFDNYRINPLKIGVLELQNYDGTLLTTDEYTSGVYAIDISDDTSRILDTLLWLREEFVKRDLVSEIADYLDLGVSSLMTHSFTWRHK
jgi:hypothetical protein